MSTKKRIEKLEQKTAASEAVLIVMDWGNGDYSVNGERMTEAEFKRRYPPSNEVITICWSEEETEE